MRYDTAKLFDLWLDLGYAKIRLGNYAATWFTVNSSLTKIHTELKDAACESNKELY